MGAARCVVAGCNLIDHDEKAPELHEGKSLVSDAWSLTPILEDGAGRGWELDVDVYVSRELSTAEARELAKALVQLADKIEGGDL